MKPIAEVLLALLSFHVLGYSQTAQKKHVYVWLCDSPPYSESVSASLTVWKKDTGIEITNDAAQLVGKEFCEENKAIMDYFDRKNISDPKEQERYLDWLVQSYLYQLRDQILKVSEKRIADEDQKVLGGLSHFQSEYSAAITIDVPAVEHYAVSVYIATLNLLASGNGQGWLCIASRPDRKAISIDGDDHGLTCKKFVLSAGHHLVRAGNCEAKDIDILEGKTQWYSCPDKTKCSKPMTDCPNP